ncbi:hypothetical protein [uncultured Meiothermus sp.]|jgi:cytochrome P450|uniref:hypothetical protein n=1 Tax=uncultured Meiothermus sp. TaxID=157471 RepID=UPI002601CD73|nr:hypothetical protein [uncultured Meiothermus sp.]
MKLDDKQAHTPTPAPGNCPVTGLGTEFNPFKDPYLADPYPFLTRARREEPVFYSPELDYWVVTRYNDIKSIFQDPATFSAASTQSPIKPLPPQAVQLLREGGYRPDQRQVLYRFGSVGMV